MTWRTPLRGFSFGLLISLLTVLSSCSVSPVPSGYEAESRIDVPGTKVLYPERVVPSAGKYEDAKRDIEPQEFDQKIDPFWDKGHADWFVTSWNSDDGLHLQQWAGKWTDPNYAAWGYDRLEPRGPKTDEPFAVGPWLEFDAPGNPESSRIFCANKIKPSDAECREWEWWARYGQYTVEFVASADAAVDVEHGGLSDMSPMSQADFEKYVRILATHVAQTVPKGQ